MIIMINILQQNECITIQKRIEYIYIYRVVANFQGAKFFGICEFQNFVEKFFTDAVNVTPNPSLYKNICVLNFRGWRSILENCKTFVT